MSTLPHFPDLTVTRDGHVVTATICRAPNNFFDLGLIKALAELFEALDQDDQCRAIVLAAQGKVFCAGADFSRRDDENRPADPSNRGGLYVEAVRLFRTSRPIIAAVQGAAVGGGLGLAAMADFRVTCPQARFSANFNRLGFHPGFGLSVTLPRLMGVQKAAMLCYTGKRIDGREAYDIGLADVLVDEVDQVLGAAQALAAEIAISAPLAVRSTRATLRKGLADAVSAATDHEGAEQAWQFRTEDFLEGVRAMAERRPPVFAGK